MRYAVSSSGVGPLQFSKSKVNTAVYKEILEHLMSQKLYGDDGLLSKQDLAPAHGTKTTTKWFADHIIT